MERIDIDEIKEYYLEQRVNGMDMSAIRRELRECGWTDEEIKDFVYVLDEEATGIMQSEPFQMGYYGYFLTAWTLLLGGIALTVATYMTSARIGGYAIIAYGPILAGLGMLGYKKISK